jgi:integrase
MKTQGARVADLLKLVERHYEVNSLRSSYTVKLYIKNHLLPMLGARVANHVRKGHVEDYKDQRKKAGASEVTINRELAVLSKAFTIGIEEELIERRPPIKLFPEPEPREGHYEHETFLKWQDACRQIKGPTYDGEVVADIVMFGYYSGWRLRECLGLHKDWIRTKDKIVVLPASKHKNKKPKIYPLEGRVWNMIEKRLANASPDGLLFHRNGRPVKNISRICGTVCGIVGVSKDHFFHNLRRSCTTNLNRAGVDKETGKKITGHLTDSVYHAYNQHDMNSLRSAVKRVEEYLEISTRENQVTSAPENVQEVQQVTAASSEITEEKHEENALILYQTNGHNTPKRETFLARLWRKITK